MLLERGHYSNFQSRRNAISFLDFATINRLRSYLLFFLLNQSPNRYLMSERNQQFDMQRPFISGTAGHQYKHQTVRYIASSLYQTAKRASSHKDIDKSKSYQIKNSFKYKYFLPRRSSDFLDILGICY